MKVKDDMSKSKGGRYGKYGEKKRIERLKVKSKSFVEGDNMEEKKVEYGYTAKLPSEEGKTKKLGSGSSKPKPIRFVKLIEPQEPKDKEIVSRVLKRVKLSSGAWQTLKEDLDNKEPKNYISRKFGIKPNDLKWLKRYLGYV